MLLCQKPSARARAPLQSEVEWPWVLLSEGLNCVHTGESAQLCNNNRLLLLASDTSDAVTVELSAEPYSTLPVCDTSEPPQAVLLLIGPPGAAPAACFCTLDFV